MKAVVRPHFRELMLRSSIRVQELRVDATQYLIEGIGKKFHPNASSLLCLPLDRDARGDYHIGEHGAFGELL